MDHTAIKQIQDTEAAKTGVDHIKYQTDGTVSALPDNYNLHDLEKYLDAPRRFRGYFETNSIQGFAEYCEEFAEDTCTCFVDAEAMGAKTEFTLGKPGEPEHRTHKAKLSLKQTSDYRGLLKARMEHHSQDQIAFWLQDFSHCAQVTDAEGEAIDLVEAIRRIRRITVEAKQGQTTEQKHFGAAKSAMESIDVKTEGPQPAYVLFTCTPYDELPVRTFHLRLHVITGQGNPKIMLKPINMEKHEEEMAQEFQALLQAKLPSEVRVFIGTFTS